MNVPQAPGHIRALTPYQPGRSIAEIREQLGLERIIKLASNENPLGPSPKAIARVRDALNTLATYPSGGLHLRKALAKHHHVQLENVVAGAGSEGVLASAMRSYLRAGEEAVTAEGTFIGFYVLASAMNLSLKTVPLKDGYSFDLDAILNAVTPKTKLIYLANPNNPTGTAFSRTDYEAFLKRVPEGALVIMDEAYFEFASSCWEEYPDSLNYPHDQVLTLRTFSKSYGLAGLRIGYGIGHRDIVANLLKVKLPFEPSALAEAAGLGALEDQEFLAKTLAMNEAGRARLRTKLSELGLSYTESVANFELIPLESAERAAWFSDQLLQHGIIARPMVAFRLPHCVRITIGKEDEMDMLLEALETIFGG